MTSHKTDEDWFRTAFDQLYPVLYAHRDDGSAAKEVRGIVKALGLKGDGKRLLDCCCGAGRHTEAFSNEGFEVTGFDLSPFLLAQASLRPILINRLARADIRRLPYDTVFDLVFNLFTSFGYFLEDSENERALAEMTRVLVPGGRLVLDHMNRQCVQDNLVPCDTSERGDCTIRQERRIENNRIIKEIEVNSAGRGPIRLYENVRLYDPDELAELFRRQGLSDVVFFGGFDGEAFTPESRRMIVIGTRQ